MMAIIVTMLVLICGYLFVIEITITIYLMYRKSPPVADCELLMDTQDY